MDVAERMLGTEIGRQSLLCQPTVNSFRIREGLLHSGHRLDAAPGLHADRAQFLGLRPDGWVRRPGWNGLCWRVGFAHVPIIESVSDDFPGFIGGELERFAILELDRQQANKTR